MATLLASSTPIPDLRKDTIVSAVIFDLEKRRYLHLANLTKYYVYFIEVTLKSGKTYLIVRRYSQFDDLEKNLDDRFPLEAGKLTSGVRKLPSLPGKIYLKRSAIREVADLRIPDLNSYLKKLINMSSRISKSDLVLNFLCLWSSDIDTPIIKGADGKVKYVAASEKARLMAQQSKGNKAPEIKPKRPLMVRGSSTDLKPQTLTGPRVQALHDFKAESSDQLSFKKGDMIALVCRVDDNWLEGSLYGKIGIIPVPFVNIIEDVIDGGWEDEWDDDNPTSVIRCHYDGAIRDIDVDPKLAEMPTYQELLDTVRKSLSSSNIVLNYRDIEGDLILLKDQEDIDLLLEVASLHPQLAISGYVPWELHITMSGDCSQYNTDPYVQW
ncbi:neutrophil cytosol factor 4-like [Saccoglossus kowalevskii]|uniref:Neutrophil cytosol factor 4-like n=1 Tax=Saccoglossus kowalevskii TaxID=10224 RepID=A0ABM0M0X4_SACKO|nr:PREDICTED: neutrophil cytosol factor 4-like [Saccoglossus kowalevskii]